MGIHSPFAIKKLEDLLKERSDKLVAAMHGTEVPSELKLVHNYPDDYRKVDSTAVRVAADDFATILKEIKAVLGKR